MVYNISKELIIMEKGCLDYFITNYRRATKKQKSFINNLLRHSDFTLVADINRISIDEAGLIIDTLLGKNIYTNKEARYLSK